MTDHPKRCFTCSDISCEYYKHRNMQYGVYDDSAEMPLALTPATFTAKKGCATWI